MAMKIGMSEPKLDSTSDRKQLLTRLFKKKMAMGGVVRKSMPAELDAEQHEPFELDDDYPADMEEMMVQDTTDEEMGPTAMRHTSANEDDERRKLIQSIMLRRAMKR